jgi:hypothetical protein
LAALDVRRRVALTVVGLLEAVRGLVALVERPPVPVLGAPDAAAAADGSPSGLLLVDAFLDLVVAPLGGVAEASTAPGAARSISASWARISSAMIPSASTRACARSRLS